MEEEIDKSFESYLEEIEVFKRLPKECKRIDPDKEIEIQKWILKMTLEEG
jgi:hypothetical protein